MTIETLGWSTLEQKLRSSSQQHCLEPLGEPCKEDTNVMFHKVGQSNAQRGQMPWTKPPFYSFLSPSTPVLCSESDCCNLSKKVRRLRVNENKPCYLRSESHEAGRNQEAVEEFKCLLCVGTISKDRWLLHWSATIATASSSSTTDSMSSLRNLLLTLSNSKQEILRNALFIPFFAIPIGLKRKLGFTLATWSLVTFLKLLALWGQTYCFSY